MKKFLAALFAAGAIFTASTSSAQVQTCEGTDEYIMSEFETIDVAKQRAKQKAERAAQEQAGVFVESTTEVNKMMVTKDEIVTMTGGILNIIDVQYQLTPLEDGKSLLVRATVKALVDTDDITAWLNRDSGERSDLVAKNLELRQAIAAQDKQISELKAQLAATDSKQEVEKISAQIAVEDKGFLSNQKLDEALKLYSSGDMNGAADRCSQAIDLNPNNAIAFSIRGTIFYQLRDYGRAVADLNKAAMLNPSDDKIFYNRGLAYVKLQDYQNAAADFTKALELNPNDAVALYNRGLCYQRLGNHSRYQADLARARSLGYNG